MTIGKAITILINIYEDAKNNEIINKPISYALYKTWKRVDNMEKPRVKESEEE